MNNVRGSFWGDTVHYDTVHYDTVHYDTVHCDTVHYDTGSSKLMCPWAGFVQKPLESVACEAVHDSTHGSFPDLLENTGNFLTSESSSHQMLYASLLYA